MKPSFKDRTPPSDTQIRDYFQILKQDSKSRVFAALAEALIRRGRLTEAEDICKLGLEANPEFSDGHLAYARVLFYLFRYKEAFQHVKVALGLDKDNAEAYLIAAEIFLSRSQKKAASEACLKVIDLDPENQEVRKILKRIGGGTPVREKTVEKESPARMSTDSFKASAGTSPGRRAIKLGGKPSLSDPFRQLLHETGEQASDKLEKDEQPFSALSSGSQPPVPPDLFSEEFEVPTKREKSPRRPDGTPIPKLPDHPPTPVPVPAPVPVPESKPPSSSSVSDTSDSQMADRVQAVIDSYADRLTTDPHDHQSPPKIPRAGRILSLLGLLALLTAIGFAIVYGLRSEVRRGTQEAAESQEAGTSLLLTDVPPPPEEEKPEEVAVEEPPAPPPPEEEVIEPVPEPVPEIKKKPKKRKKTKKRKKRRKRRRRRR